MDIKLQLKVLVKLKETRARLVSGSLIQCEALSK